MDKKQKEALVIAMPVTSSDVSMTTDSANITMFMYLLSSSASNSASLLY